VAFEAARVAPRAGRPLGQHAALAVATDQRGARDLLERVLRAAAPRAHAHRLGDRPVAAVAAIAQAERAAVPALEDLHADRERCRRRTDGALAAASRRRRVTLGLDPLRRRL